MCFGGGETCPPPSAQETAPTPTAEARAGGPRGREDPAEAGRPRAQRSRRGDLTWRTTSLGSCAARNSSSTRPLAATFLVLSMSQ